MKALLIAVAMLLVGGRADAQRLAEPVDLKGAFFALSAADAKRLTEWYRTHLGFRTLSEGSVAERGIVFSLIEKDGYLIEIVQRPTTGTPPRDASGSRDAIALYGIFKIGFAVSNLQTVHDRLRDAGVVFNHGIVRPTGNPLRTFAVRDPEGNIVQFFG